MDSIFRYGAAKSTFFDYCYTALVRTAERGVKVRIIQDGKMGRPDGCGPAEIANIIYNHNNIELYYFNGINIFDPAGLATIMHDKATIVDGNKMIVGGANMGDFRVPAQLRYGSACNQQRRKRKRGSSTTIF